MQKKSMIKMIHVLVLVGISLYTVCMFLGFGIRYNASESLPHTLYFAIPKKGMTKEIDKGQIVLFNLPTTSVNFAKRVEGLPGDMVVLRLKITAPLGLPL